MHNSRRNSGNYNGIYNVTPVSITVCVTPVSITARHLTPSISIKTTGYVTEQLLVVRSAVFVLSQIEEWCFPLHFTHYLLLRHSEARCLVPV